MDPQTIHAVLFWVVAVLTGVCAVSVVVTQNIVRSATWLLFTLAGTSAIFFLLGADFVGATQLLVYVGGTLVVLKEVTGSNGNYELRSFTEARGAFDATRAQLFVQIIGDGRAVDVSAKHDPGMHFTGTAWAAGANGTSVYLPNVDPDGGTTKLVIANATPLSTIPLVAGSFTYVVVVGH